MSARLFIVLAFVALAAGAVTGRPAAEETTGTFSPDTSAGPTWQPTSSGSSDLTSTKAPAFISSTVSSPTDDSASTERQTTDAPATPTVVSLSTELQTTDAPASPTVVPLSTERQTTDAPASPTVVSLSTELQTTDAPASPTVVPLSTERQTTDAPASPTVVPLSTERQTTDAPASPTVVPLSTERQTTDAPAPSPSTEFPSTTGVPTSSSTDRPDESLFFGELQEGDRPLLSQLVYRSAKRYHASKEVVQWSGQGEAYLTAIKIVDLQRDGNNARVGMFSGGIGEGSVALKFASQYGGAINYHVTLYGRLYDEE